MKNPNRKTHAGAKWNQLKFSIMVKAWLIMLTICTRPGFWEKNEQAGIIKEWIEYAPVQLKHD